MKEKLIEKIVAYNVRKGYESDVSNLAETLIECGVTKKEFGHDEHRWYTTYLEVKQFDDFFVQFATYTNSGDEPAMETSEWHEMIIESAREVFPKEVTVIDYFPAVEEK